MILSEYERLLEEVREKVDFYRRKNAREYVPSMFRALSEENPDLTPGGARVRLEKDCSDMWQKRTILEFLPDEAKDAKRQESGRLGQKKRVSAAVSAAKQKEKEAITIDTKGRPVENPSYILPRSDKNKQNNAALEEIEVSISRQEILKYIMMLKRTQSQDDNIRLRVILDRLTFQVISTDIIKTVDVSRLEQGQITDSTYG